MPERKIKPIYICPKCKRLAGRAVSHDSDSTAVVFPLRPTLSSL